MKIITVIVTYNASKWIDKTLSSFINLNSDNHIIIVDNNSSDNTVKLINEHKQDVELIELKDNIGFGKGNNIGIEKALKYNSDYIFLLNQDAYIDKGNFELELNNLLKLESIGIVSPVHLSGNGSTLDFGFYDCLHPTKTNALKDAFEHNISSYYEISFVNAAAWFIKSSLIKKIGSFNPIFSHYGEDNEYCIRMQNYGKKLVVSPNIFIKHDRPQFRANNPFFEQHKILKRVLLLSFFENKHSIPKDAGQRFFKLALLSLITFKFKASILTIREYFSYKKDIKKLIKN